MLNEENLLIGWRSVSRCYDPKCRPACELEREGRTNIKLMVFFCRILKKGKRDVRDAEQGHLRPRIVRLPGLRCLPR